MEVQVLSSALRTGLGQDGSDGFGAGVTFSWSAGDSMLIGVESRAAERNAETAGFRESVDAQLAAGDQDPADAERTLRVLGVRNDDADPPRGSKGAARKRPLGDTKNALLVGGQLAGSLKIVFGDEDLAPAAEGRAPEDPSRRDVGVAVDAVDALAAKESTKSLGRAFVRNDGQPHPLHTFIFTLSAGEWVSC